MRASSIYDVDLTRPWWRFWSFVLPAVLSATVFERDGALVGGVVLVALCVAFWPMTFAPVAYQRWGRQHQVLGNTFTALPVAFPAFSLWFEEASLGTRVLLCVGFALVVGLMTLARVTAGRERGA